MFKFDTHRKTTVTAATHAKHLHIAPFLYRQETSEQVFYVARNSQLQAKLCHQASEGIPLQNIDLRHPVTQQPLCCINCGEPLRPHDPPFPIPESYDPLRKTFTIQNVFAHHERCAARYLLSHNIFTTSTQYAVLCLMARQLFHIKEVRPASDVTELQKYGGPLTVEEYLGDTTHVVTPVTERLVPHFVVSQLRLPPNISLPPTTGPTDFVADSTRVLWSCAGLTRAPPPTDGRVPHVPLQPPQPTPFDHWLDLVKEGTITLPTPPPPKPVKARKATVSRKQRLLTSTAAVLQASAPLPPLSTLPPPPPLLSNPPLGPIPPLKGHAKKKARLTTANPFTPTPTNTTTTNSSSSPPTTTTAVTTTTTTPLSPPPKKTRRPRQKRPTTVVATSVPPFLPSLTLPYAAYCVTTPTTLAQLQLPYPAPSPDTRKRKRPAVVGHQDGQLNPTPSAAATAATPPSPLGIVGADM